MNWRDYPNFSKSEFDCKETGENGMTPDFMAMLQKLRTRYGKPMIITSGYRSPRHSIERRKAQPGTHAQGIACDIGVSGADAQMIVMLALELGFTGIGVSQKNGSPRFIHLDTAPRRAIWSY
jgi:zinc D-Ala-D-Ala carboxypeptidase